MDIHWEFAVTDDGTIYFGGRGDDSRGMGDIYMSRQVDGVFQEPVNPGKTINTSSSEQCPMISPDGKHLFFLSGRGQGSDIWWVDAKVLTGK